MIRKKKRYILIRTDTEVSDLAVEIRKKIKSDYGDERFKFGLKIYVKTNKTCKSTAIWDSLTVLVF